MKKLFNYALFLISCINFSIVYADCKFQVTNYSSFNITVEAGFYAVKDKKVTFNIPSTQTSVGLIKSDSQCNATTLSNLGSTYIRLTGEKSVGSWIYIPDSNMIRASGTSVANNIGNVGTIGIAPNGTYILLRNNYKPDKDKFAVVIENADRNISRQKSSM